MRKIILFTIAMSLSASVSVAEIVGKIKSINADKSKSLILSKDLGEIKTGDILSLNNNCFIEVIKKSTDKIIVSTELCENKNILKKNRVVKLFRDEQNAGAGYASTSSSATSSAQTRTSYIPPKSRNFLVVSEGVRVGLFTSFFDGKLEVTDKYGFDITQTGDVKDNYSLSLGYAKVSIKSLGFLTHLSFTSYSGDARSVRLDGSGTYGINENFYLLGGLNLHKFTNSGPKELDAELGVQLGAGIQVNQNFGINLAYVTLNNGGQVDGNNYDFKADGLELGIHGTF